MLLSLSYQSQMGINSTDPRSFGQFGRANSFHEFSKELQTYLERRFQIISRRFQIILRRFHNYLEKVPEVSWESSRTTKTSLVWRRLWLPHPMYEAEGSEKPASISMVFYLISMEDLVSDFSLNRSRKSMIPLRFSSRNHLARRWKTQTLMQRGRGCGNGSPIFNDRITSLIPKWPLIYLAHLTKPLKTVSSRIDTLFSPSPILFHSSNKHHESRHHSHRRAYLPPHLRRCQKTRTIFSRSTKDLFTKQRKIRGLL